MERTAQTAPRGNIIYTPAQSIFTQICYHRLCIIFIAAFDLCQQLFTVRSTKIHLKIFMSRNASRQMFISINSTDSKSFINNRTELLNISFCGS